MTRQSILSFIVVAAGTGALLAGTAQSQVGPPKAFVALQPTTPGTAQSGHAHVSGTIRASQLVGGGAGVTGVDAVTLGGLAPTAFGRLALPNAWTGVNTFSNAANSFTGNGSGLTSVNADLLDGLNSTAFLQAVPNPLSLTSSVASNATIRGENSNATGIGVMGLATSTTGLNSGGDFRSSSSTGRGVFGSATSTTGANYGVFGETNSTTGRGVYGQALAATGINFGGSFQSASVDGRGVYGFASSAMGSNYGVFGQSSSNSGRGVYGQSTNASGVNFGVYGQSASVTGFGTVGWASAVTGTNYGVLGESSSTGGRGVYGHATATSGSTVGVYGTSRSSAGTGIFGEVIATTGINYGVLGLQSASAAGWGVFANGALGASGFKSFRIDHPDDPENRYILHYSSESPSPQNFYSGNATTDARGCVWIDLPDYFESINANFKYQLTVVDGANSDDFVIAKIGRKIQNGRFLIRTNAPNVEVSWRIEADRNDAYIRNANPKDVVEKQGEEKGTYQHPELFDQPKERGLAHRINGSRPSVK